MSGLAQMNIDQLEALVVVVETGSLQAAAKSLRISRAALRTRIEELEARVGQPLLDRGRLGTLPTPAGEALAGRGRVLVQQARALLAAVGEVGNEPAGLMRVNAPVGLPPHLLTMLFLRFRERMPGLQIRATFDSDPVAGLLDDVDAAFHFGPRAPQGPWLTSVLYRMPERLVATRSYLERFGTPTDTESLRQHTLLTWEPPGEDARRWPTAEGEMVAVEPVLFSADVHLVRTSMLAGAGIARVPDAGFPDPGFEPGDVVTLLPERFNRECTLRLLVPEVLAELPKSRRVIEEIREFTRSI